MLSTIWSMYVHYSSVVAHNPVFIYGMGVGAGVGGTFAFQEIKKNPAILKK